MNRFDSYMRGAKLARILADEAFLEYKKGNDKKALGQDKEDPAAPPPAP